MCWPVCLAARSAMVSANSTLCLAARSAECLAVCLAVCLTARSAMYSERSAECLAAHSAMVSANSAECRRTASNRLSFLALRHLRSHPKLTVLLILLAPLAHLLIPPVLAEAGPIGSVHASATTLADSRADSPADSHADSPADSPADSRADSLVAAAMAQIGVTVLYDGSYQALDYPGGDVPANAGACSDVLIRAYRALGSDLQVLVHNDMAANFDAYPQSWGLSGPDPNIDHRRVLNLLCFFARNGETLPRTSDPSDYHAGDIVAWELSPGILHIGLVSDRSDRAGSTPLILHNVGAGVRLEEFLFSHPIVGHYRY